MYSQSGMQRRRRTCVRWYEPTDEVDSEALLAQTTSAAEWSDEDKASPVSATVKLRRWLPWILHVFLLSMSLHIILDAYESRMSNARRSSPALEAVGYANVVFDGVLDWPSKYRGPPSDAIDDAWDRISLNNSHKIMPLRVHESDLIKVDQDARPSIARFRDEDGGGFLAGIEIGHQLHCLDLLRRHTYIDHYGPMDDNYVLRPAFYRVHLDHCIEMLRQVLMCNADVGLITFDWVAGFDVPFPNFSTLHKCRNVDEHAIDLPMNHLVRVGDVVDLTPGDVGAGLIRHHG
ncbi:uncharacterized protein B0H18DRAFT_1034076 [Fomitopsis serialis]|uniref:uncharacterized protein n=1 Tax=Fomitopsis serialis TaxID=139415 RepID=UPI0020084125|nr:uncharacterized protein B0H18DRAFT_1034076 [Neoantrodia serialis]KAH9917538.1 hypothetical protein B0H18DRAFT_1034076 [Neoantrodia serialis]